ncbi:hypothetical protein MOP88_04150 [Sphingomonas sp. WKB10]|nr:hypothetical protein [Sphingomonas sp. WKB10]
MMVRLQPDQLAALDAWIALQSPPPAGPRRSARSSLTGLPPMLERLRRRWRQFRRGRRNDIRVMMYELESTKVIDPIDSDVVRLLSNDALHRWIGKATNRQSLSLLDRELRRREAWAVPAGRAYWISVASLVIAIGALIVSIAKI